MSHSKEGHLSILVEGGTSSAASGWISQLDVCQLLSLGSQVIYPVGLNGCEVPVIMSLPESLAKGTTMFRGKTVYLPVDNLQSTMKGQESKSPSPGGHSFPSWLQPYQGSSAQGGRAGQHDHRSEGAPILGSIDTSGQALGGSTPKRLEPMVLVTPLPPQAGRFPQTSGYIFPGGCPRWRQNGQPHPRGGTCHLLLYTQNPGAQWWCPSHRHCPPMGRGH